MKPRYSLKLAFAVLLVSSVVVAACVALFEHHRQRGFELALWEFRQISLAIQNHESASGRLPAPVYHGRSGLLPLCSWRVFLCPFLEMQSLPRIDVNVAWDDPSNSMYHKLTLYTLPSVNHDDDGRTRVFAILGEGTAVGDGVDEPAKTMREAPHDLAVVVEVHDSKTNWMAPGDYHLDTLEKSILDRNGKFKSGAIGGRFHVIFADGEVWALDVNTPYNAFVRFLTTEGANAADRDADLGSYCLGRSN